MTKAADAALTRRAAALPTSMPCHHLHAPALRNAHGRNLVLKNPSAPQVRVHASATGACPGVRVNTKSMDPSLCLPASPLPTNLGLSSVTDQASALHDALGLGAL